ncbi:hypothetical protein LEP1GSC132_4194 [Leptospira kirschneri str. 200803703]|uniref:Uncharacterized protein n=1 Tax=Leptospira kirschneri str. 200802841 TaxID=1193047 RepID=A0A828XXH1_9LEPT|nr:hypothetical protein LEP1GSC131_2640 [Leptospira kirschneri str. 200802841]EMK08408.1 hypothetical protein LEP1GSC166_0240 [Leptospira kirschneri]EMO68493.1 hypothetical protein LEP1GSC132_4194 [Leptospira kirschneri str. 200803703]EMO75260.1 hypothetical protein LEP1GSC127_2856 [Leptospira kirschneri str. 200801925]EMO81581.1 hypothetical protein LEP1GSC126_0647 [Leptospira kirschneri str. 200801774]
MFKRWVFLFRSLKKIIFGNFLFNKKLNFKRIRFLLFE